MSKPEITGENRKSKDENGKFISGVSGNPNGRPKGTLSITSAIRKKLEKKDPKTNKTYLSELVDIMIEKALRDRDFKVIKEIWNHIDGLPKQSLDVKEEKPMAFMWVDQISSQK